MADKYGTNTDCTCGHYESDHYISNAGIYHECEEDGCDCRVYNRVEQENMRIEITDNSDPDYLNAKADLENSRPQILEAAIEFLEEFYPNQSEDIKNIAPRYADFAMQEIAEFIGLPTEGEL